MAHMNRAPNPLLQLQQVTFRYQHNISNATSPPTENFNLRLADLGVHRGESIAITGPSGSGKTTLLHLIAGILLPEHGTILFANSAINQQNERWRRHYRAQQIGMVFQSFELLEYLSVMENILLPLRLTTGSPPTQSYRSRAMILARETGIEHKLQCRPARLSQGEQQRVAVCRALICKPQLILADEPTGNLDPTSKQRVVKLLLEQCAQSDTAMLMVTHDESLIPQFDRHYSIDQLRQAADGSS